MDTLEERVTRGLQEVADTAPSYVRGDDTHVRGADSRISAPRLVGVAAATVLAIGGVAWTTTLPNHNEPQEATPSAADRPSQPDDTAESPTRDDVIEVTERFANLQDVAGFGRTEVTYDPPRVALRWVGEPPPRVAAMLGEQPNGVEVVLLPAAFSQAELAVATKRVFEADENPRGEMSAVLPTPQMDGLIAEVSAAWRGSEEDLRKAAGLPVDIRRVDGPAQLLGGD